MNYYTAHDTYLQVNVKANITYRFKQELRFASTLEYAFLRQTITDQENKILAQGTWFDFRSTKDQTVRVHLSHFSDCNKREMDNYWNLFTYEFEVVTTCFTAVLYRDKDGDGFGAATSDSLSNGCQNQPIQGYSFNKRDCNDNDKNINPSASENFDNEVDDNCDGKIGQFKGCKDIFAVNYSPKDTNLVICVYNLVYDSASTANKTILDTTVANLNDCLFNYGLTIDSVKLASAQLLLNKDTVLTEWKIFQGGVSVPNVIKAKYFSTTLGDVLYILKLSCTNSSGRVEATSSVTLAAVATTEVERVSSVANNTVSSGYSIYPNPTTQAFTISSSTALGEVSIVNIHGAEVFKTLSTSTQLQITLPSQEPGVYFVKIGNITTKLLKN